MKPFFIVVVLLFVCIVRSEDTKDRSAYGGSATAPTPMPFPTGGYASDADISAIPCARNFLFSCQPSLQPAPCAQAIANFDGVQALASNGGTGAYSENYPVYALQVPQYIKGSQTY